MARKSRKNIDMAAIESVNSTPLYNAAGYIRLSVEDSKKKGDSVDTQKAILENIAALSADIELCDFYIDNGTTGLTFERPAFQKMLADVESGKINCIIVKDLSRFGRNAIDTGYYIEKYLPSLGCRFIAVTDDFDTNSDMNGGTSVMLPLKNLVNEAYAVDIGRKIKAQQHQAMKSGEYVGGRPPYGYLKAENDCHKLVIDPVTAPIVHQIFEWFLDEISVNHIVRQLNEAKIATPSYYRKENGLITHENLLGNGAWQTFTVTRILKDEVYVGDMVQGKSKSIGRKQTKVDESEWIRVADTHEAIISRDMFAKAQERLKYLADRAESRQKTSYTPNIFKGKVFCGHCGGSMHRVRRKRKKSDDFYGFYCLSNSRKARGSCESFIMPEKSLIDVLLETIKSHADVIMGKSLKLRVNSAQIHAKLEQFKVELKALNQEADKNFRMIKSLYESLASGLIDKDEYREMRAKFENKTEENLARIAELERQHAEINKQIAEYYELEDLISSTGKNGVTAKVIECLVDKIRIFSDRSVEISFKFDSGFEMISEVTADE